MLAYLKECEDFCLDWGAGEANEKGAATEFIVIGTRDMADLIQAALVNSPRLKDASIELRGPSVISIYNALVSFCPCARRSAARDGASPAKTREVPLLWCCPTLFNVGVYILRSRRTGSHHILSSPSFSPLRLHSPPRSTSFLQDKLRARMVLDPEPIAFAAVHVDAYGERKRGGVPFFPAFVKPRTASCSQLAACVRNEAEAVHSASLFS